MKLFVATHNAHKIREMSQILPDFEIVADDPEGVEENAPDFVGNAFIKVRAIAAKHPGAWCMADDSGLEVRALGGAPGVRSARYAGEPSNTPANNALLLRNLVGVKDRTANFTCAVALVDPEGGEHTAVGKCFGKIALAPSGAQGFGYDPLFVPDGHDKSFAELSAEEKNAISHRGRALEKVKEIVDNAEGRETGDDRRDGSSCLASNVSCPATQPPNHCTTQPPNHPWLRLFRVVNLPTVPGDVFVGAAVGLVSIGTSAWHWPSLAHVWWAALASVFLYMFGLVHNDIVGAKKDRDRPIPNGEISLDSALAASVVCLACGFGVAWFGGLIGEPFWSSATWSDASWLRNAVWLVIAIMLYNRFKRAWMMGACRGLNVVLGAAAVGCVNLRALMVAVLWWLYITLVTLYSEGEDKDPAKKRRVGMLVGGIVYLQLVALVVLSLQAPGVAALRSLLVAGAVMLVLLRVFKTLLPKVSAS